MSQEQPKNKTHTKSKQSHPQNNEQALRVMVKEALDYDLAHHNVELASHEQFEKLWLKAVQKPREHTHKYKDRQVNAVNAPYFKPSSWFLSPILFAGLCLGIMLITLQFNTKLPANEQAALRNELSELTADETLVTLFASEHLEYGESEDFLSWLDHDDWSLSLDL